MSQINLDNPAVLRELVKDQSDVVQLDVEPDNRGAVVQSRGGRTGYSLFTKQCALDANTPISKENLGEFSKAVASAWKDADQQMWLDLARETDGETIYGCVKCSREFKSENKKRYHEKTCGEVHTCTHCDKQYKSISALQKHLKVHNAEFLCPTCKKCFNSEGNLSRHNKVCKATGEVTQ